jgi:hypothetical protein
LDFINGKPKAAVEHLVSVIRSATLKALIEIKLEMDKSELKKDFLEFVKYLEEMSIIHDEHCHVVEHNTRLATLARRTMSKETMLCYALLRMRPLSMPCAECSVVISCGKVDYDKPG